jgi:ABC-type nickel/cobalt efflux system permease component RcnA
MRRRRLVLFVVLFGLLSSVFSFAHPMGNFSVNHESKIILARDFIEIRYFLDLAEIPTYQEFQAAGIQAKADDPAVNSYAAQKGELLSRGLRVEIDGRRLPLKASSHAIIFPLGAGGLPTMKLGFVYRTSIPLNNRAAQHALRFEDGNFAERAGWKEVVIEAQDVSLKQSSAPQSDRSAELTNYPTDLVNSPPQQTLASAEFILPVADVAARSLTSGHRIHAAASHSIESRPPVQRDAKMGATTAAPTAALNIQPNVQKTPRSRFTELIAAEHLDTWFVLSALLIALSLGALHALEPGHGKTIVAAYLVGSRGGTRDAVVLGATVTAAHTAGVYILGLITLYASRYIVPERLYPWLALLSGILIVGLGVALFLQHLTGASMTHEEDASRPHSHWNFGLSRKKNASAKLTLQNKRVSLGKLIALGITGGIIPCPAALVVLLSAVALHRIGFGLILIVAFSVGLAAVLIAIGILMVHAGKLISRFDEQGRLAARWLPILSSVFIACLGIAMLWQPISALGAHLHFNQMERAPALLAVIGLGLLLGIRHSTDADHVVAVSTIVSQQSRIRDAAMIGALWGVGHTLTIGVVGSVIILFNVAIPPRIGLSMEFSVAIMLILLGVLNLTGIMQWLSARLTRRETGGSEKRPALTAKAESFLDRMVGRFGLYQIARPLIVGTVHGLAGSAAVALLVLATISAPVWAIVYLLIFGLGTILGMMVMTIFIALPFTYSGRFRGLNWGLRFTSGLMSMAFGLFLAYHIGFVDGLFSSSPQWTPR